VYPEGILYQIVTAMMFILLGISICVTGIDVFERRGSVI
jgi:hypothetical membrane protein